MSRFLDITEIQKRLNAMPAAMNAKGLREPNAQFEINANAASSVVLCWHKDGGRPYESKYEWLRDDSNDPAILLDMADAFIADLPTKDELRKAEFVKALASLIEKGREADIDVETMNPLVTLSKKLSENAITDKSGELS